MTRLEKRIARLTSGRRWEKGQVRQIVLTLEPPATLTVRLAGTRDAYPLSAEQLYELAVIQHVREVDREAKRLQKEEGLHKRQAIAKARKNLKKGGRK